MKLGSTILRKCYDTKIEWNLSWKSKAGSVLKINAVRISVIKEENPYDHIYTEEILDKSHHPFMIKFLTN